MALNPYQVFLMPLLTEKSVQMQDKYSDRPGRPDYVKYTVEVHPEATKPEIRKALEELFPEVRGNIVKINTIRLRGEIRDPDRFRGRRRFRRGRTRTRKKAIITLRGGVRIPQFEGI
ncbi:MAG: 50S ribosomal protein L23 [Candidatus Poribacteria bacterium]|nr:MAG: 50S ribosomal protein L23 [Candidatus Poribacteria bacterium]